MHVHYDVLNIPVNQNIGNNQTSEQLGQQWMEVLLVPNLGSVIESHLVRLCNSPGTPGKPIQ